MGPAPSVFVSIMLHTAKLAPFHIQHQQVVTAVLGCTQFGVPLYGGTLVGQVVYLKGNAKGCNIFEKRLPATELPTILLVDRGGAQHPLCTHVLATEPAEIFMQHVYVKMLL